MVALAPCANALVAAGITRVVAASRDPYVQVSGEGFRKLMAAGVVVDTGLMETAARELNRGFFSRIERGRPWVRIKMAASLDGRTAVADGDSKWISSEASRADVQLWRARCGALPTGSGTALADDPPPTVRPPPAMAWIRRETPRESVFVASPVHAGAIARETLVQAAMNARGDASRSNWQVQDGVVIHSSGTRYSYGQLAGAAALLTPPILVAGIRRVGVTDERSVPAGSSLRPSG